MIKNISCNVILITSDKAKLSNLDIEKYNEQYDNLKIIYDDTFHDHYFILDRAVVYHCGTSVNYAGNRTFSINILEDQLIKKSLIKNIINIMDIVYK